MKHSSKLHILMLALAATTSLIPQTLCARIRMNHAHAQIYMGNQSDEKAFRQLPVLQQARQEAHKILSTHASKNHDEALSAKNIAELLVLAQKTTSSSKESSATQTLMEAAKTNGITSLKTLYVKVLGQQMLNTSINRWIKAYEWNKVAKNPAFIEISQELKKKLTLTTPDEETSARQLYNIIFGVFAVQTIETFKKTVAPEILDKFNATDFYILVQKYSQMMQLREESEFKICALIYAEPLINRLGITDPETAQTILEPLYKDAPLNEIKSLIKGILRLNKEKSGLHYFIPNQRLLSLPLAAQSLNRMLHAPIKSMNKQTVQALYYTLGNLTHGMSVINETVNLATQNVGPYKKSSDELETKLQQAMKECAQLTKTFTEAIEVLQPKKPQLIPKSADSITTPPQNHSREALHIASPAISAPAPMAPPEINSAFPPAAAPAPEIHSTTGLITAPETHPAPAPIAIPTPSAPPAI